MNGIRIVLIALLGWATAAGCTIGAPERASSIQNPHAITDDIWSTSMARTDTQKIHDPNLPTTIPNNWQVPPD